MSRAQSVRHAKFALGGAVALFALLVVATLGLGVTVGDLTQRNTLVAGMGGIIALVGLQYLVYAEAYSAWLAGLMAGETDYDAVEVDPDDVKQRKRGGLLMVVGGVLAIVISVL
ncbi:hypothetical protein [Haloarchaeobius sp. HME9146]|uniref:hypothetical protein n=1 Tax=Haloarchaeobius sp. HME9146 TaxID=2978732 RepID=UPI0021C08669|nr:hypothetical protein [Haloarchaeobius sp. HME9146]MCT9095402.1 hypothetical protein [Haloarchaeobius sp. HME9146]